MRRRRRLTEGAAEEDGKMRSFRTAIRAAALLARDTAAVKAQVGMETMAMRAAEKQRERREKRRAERRRAREAARARGEAVPEEEEGDGDDAEEAEEEGSGVAGESAEAAARRREKEQEAGVGGEDDLLDSRCEEDGVVVRVQVDDALRSVSVRPSVLTRGMLYFLYRTRLTAPETSEREKALRPEEVLARTRMPGQEGAAELGGANAAAAARSLPPLRPGASQQEGADWQAQQAGQAPLTFIRFDEFVYLFSTLALLDEAAVSRLCFGVHHPQGMPRHLRRFEVAKLVETLVTDPSAVEGVERHARTLLQELGLSNWIRRGKITGRWRVRGKRSDRHEAAERADNQFFFSVDDVRAAVPTLAPPTRNDGRGPSVGQRGPAPLPT